MRKYLKVRLIACIIIGLFAGVHFRPIYDTAHNEAALRNDITLQERSSALRQFQLDNPDNIYFWIYIEGDGGALPSVFSLPDVGGPKNLFGGGGSLFRSPSYYARLRASGIDEAIYARNLLQPNFYLLISDTESLVVRYMYYRYNATPEVVGYFNGVYVIRFI